ncbi:MAG: four helix bundle protein [Bacteroidetes bacterium MedPE-SWsnd-G2]|nr:MAG: four helix bundle protein [Bacteroidetes bacterium MedPE-SWsnd-G2]
MDHIDLEVWKSSMDLVECIYQVSSVFPDSEKFGLTNQIRRAVVSVPSNIAEGSARKSDKELLQFISIALGSLAEVETQLLIAKLLKYILNIDKELKLILKVKQLLLGFRNYIKRK